MFALSPGASALVKIEVTMSALRLVDAMGVYRVLEGSYVFSVGGNSPRGGGMFAPITSPLLTTSISIQA